MSRIVLTGHQMRDATVPRVRLRFVQAAIRRCNKPTEGHHMVRTLLGLIAQRIAPWGTAAVVAAAFISSPSAASTLPIPTPAQFNGPYSLGGSDSVSFGVPVAQGNLGASDAGTYFDYVFEFTTSQSSYVTATVGPGGTADFSEMHMMFYDNSPEGSSENLYTGADLAAFYTDPLNPNDNLIDVSQSATWSTAGSVGQLPNGAFAVLEPTGFDQNTQTPYHLVSLSGTYFLRIFGILSPSTPDFALSATISTAAVTPIPPALPLFLSAIGGLGFLARRRRNAAVA
jgi:hypothetical protein